MTPKSTSSATYFTPTTIKPRTVLPPLPPNACQLEASVRPYARCLEKGEHVEHCLNRLIQVCAPLGMLKKYNVRKLAGKYLYDFKTMDRVVQLAEKIKGMEKKNVFLSGNIAVSSTLDCLLKVVRANNQV